MPQAGLPCPPALGADRRRRSQERPHRRLTPPHASHRKHGRRRARRRLRAALRAMNGLLFSHSPLSAQTLHCGLRSTHAPGPERGITSWGRNGSAWILRTGAVAVARRGGGKRAREGDRASGAGRTAVRRRRRAGVELGRKSFALRSHHFVAVHFVPLITGHPACIDAGSISLPGVMLKNTRASLRACNEHTRKRLGFPPANTSAHKTRVRAPPLLLMNVAWRPKGEQRWGTRPFFALEATWFLAQEDHSCPSASFGSAHTDSAHSRAGSG